MGASNEVFSETTSSLARKAGANPVTVREYADRNLIESLRLESGVRLFKPSAIARVQELRAQGLARRGRRSSTEAGWWEIDQICSMSWHAYSPGPP
jgi:hypothetical protein